MRQSDPDRGQLRHQTPSESNTQTQNTSARWVDSPKPGKYTCEGTIEIPIPYPAQLQQFLESGGTVLAIGSSTILGKKLGLPISDALVEIDEDGNARRLGRTEYYLPGSVLRSRVDNAAFIAHGMGDEVDIFFDNSPVFRLGPNAASDGVGAVAWFDAPEPLRSGWAWGQKYLEGAASVISAEVGDGHLYLFGPEITFRAQPHGTFKFLFNGLALSSAEEGAPR